MLIHEYTLNTPNLHSVLGLKLEYMNMGRRTNRKLKSKNKIKKRNKRITARAHKSVSSRVSASVKYIRNLSDYKLNDSEITALGKGLNFVPSSIANITSIMKDFLTQKD